MVVVGAWGRRGILLTSEGLAVDPTYGLILEELVYIDERPNSRCKSITAQPFISTASTGGADCWAHCWAKKQRLIL